MLLLTPLTWKQVDAPGHPGGPAVIMRSLKVRDAPAEEL